MRPEENIEKFVKDRKPRATTSGKMDRQTLQDSFAVMEQTAQAKSTKPNVIKVFRRSRVVRLAAAVIIVAVGLLFIERGRQSPNGTETGSRPVAQSPVEKMSLMSMRMAYRRGGFDALDRQFRDTLNALEPQPLNVSMQELLEGANGS